MRGTTVSYMYSLNGEPIDVSWAEVPVTFRGVNVAEAFDELLGYRWSATAERPELEDDDEDEDMTPQELMQFTSDCLSWVREYMEGIGRELRLAEGALEELADGKS